MWTHRRPHHLGYRLPAPADPPVVAACFAWLPVTCPGQAAQLEWLYATALAEARAVARPSLPERDLAGVWN